LEQPSRVRRGDNHADNLAQRRSPDGRCGRCVFAKRVIDRLGATPILLAALVLNVAVLTGFAYVLNEVSHAMERRESIINIADVGSHPAGWNPMGVADALRGP